MLWEQMGGGVTPLAPAHSHSSARMRTDGGVRAVSGKRVRMLWVAMSRRMRVPRLPTPGRLRSTQLRKCTDRGGLSPLCAFLRCVLAHAR